MPHDLPVPLATSTALAHPRDRGVLRVLDDCLKKLEDDHERGETEVSEALAQRFGAFVLGLTAGMAISEALELVFSEQEDVLRPKVAARAGPGRNGKAWYSQGPAAGAQPLAIAYPNSSPNGRQLSATEARDLTHEIKSGLCHVSSFLLKAHDGKAWAALGYSSWATYVQVEFGFSRSRSYELLEHGRVLQALAAAAGVSGIPDISPYASSQIKPHLAELMHDIRTQAAGRPEVEAQEVVVGLVGTLRESLSRDHAAESLSESQNKQSGMTGSNRGQSTFDIEQLLDAVEYLARMPSVPSVIGSIPDLEAERLASLPSAVRWLSEFAAHWAGTRCVPYPA